MAKKKDANNEIAVEKKQYDNTVRRYWRWPTERSKKFANELKEKKHTIGNKKGQELNDYEKGMRAGYLLSQSDNAGAYNYRKAREAGLSSAEAKTIAKKKRFKFGKKSREE